MKQMFEHSITILVMVIVLLVISSVMIVNMQIQTARRVHAGIIEQYQTSYYTVDLESINANLHETYPSWNVSVIEYETVSSRRDAEVILDYEVIVPVFNLTKTAKITGYAR